MTEGTSLAPDLERPVIDVLAQGRCSVDLTFLGLPHLPRLGEDYYVSGFGINPGAGFINVASLRRLGLRVGLATDLGTDLFSRYILERFRAEDIDETFVRIQDRDLTVLTVGLSFPPDRTFITWEEQDVFGSRGVLIEDLRRYRVGCLFSHVAFTADVYAEAREQGIPICIDSFWDREFLTSAAAQAAIAQADAFLPNQVEACTITGTTTAEAALAALAPRCPMVAIKLGAAGVIGSFQGRCYRVPALPVEVIDTTGAGDNFDGGFIYGLVRGLPFEECLRCAVVAGSLSTRRAGGVAASPTVDELRAGLAALGPSEKSVHLSQC
jgi:sugar/nucleoside kinase (ribokinase family)